VPEHTFTIAALGHSVDAQTNNMTLFSVLEQIGPPQLPVRLAQLTLVTLWRREEGDLGVEFTQRLAIMDPDGEEVASLEQSFVLDRPRLRTFSVVGNLTFSKMGTYRFEVRLKRADEQEWGAPVACYPLDVMIASAPDDQQLLRPERGGPGT
jgi:hypothetical protein